MFFNALLIFLTFFTRFWGIFWGDGLFFHPDENNMATALSQLSWQNFHPHFFAYGQFPLYFGFFLLKLVGLDNTFANSIYILRFLSALFSSLSLLFFYRLYRSKIFILLLIFTPGLIQLAHFGTTESLLILVFAINLFLAKLIIQNPKPIYFLFVSLNTGIGLATKISSIIFLAPLFFAIFLTNFKNKFYLLFLTSYCLLFTLLLSFVFSPYNLISNSDFLSTARYETEVATGTTKVFYTNQFLGSTPYLFQITKIFPHAIGLPMFIFGLIGLFFLNRSHLFIFLPSLLYFAYFGQVYTKWTRFMSPIFFIFPFLAAYFITRFKKSFIVYLLSFISVLPGLYFLKIYFQPDIRLTASNWISQNIPPESRILSEAGNVINLPFTSHSQSITNFDFYNLDTNPLLQNELINQIFQSDYILIPSRRIFKNQNNPNFPFSQNYYTNLFNGNLGFKEIKTFSVINDEDAEETWSVFDHPKIRIYQKVKHLDLGEYENILHFSS